LPAFTFVTVVFDAEFDLLELQARSLARHASPEVVHEVLVIDNSRRGIGAKREQALRAQYGQHAGRVRIVRPLDVAAIPPTTGWYAQQILKLLVSRKVTSDAYVVLDAKNHLVRQLVAEFFLTADGRLRTSRQSFTEHRLGPDLLRTLDYFEVPRAEARSFTPTVTPFALRTDLVRDLVQDVEARTHRPFALEFLSARLLEFFAYSAWIMARRPPIGDVYVFDQPGSPTVWPKGATGDGVAAAMERVSSGESPWFSVHRRALGVLDEPALDRLANLWIAAGLFASPGDAELFVRRAQHAVRAGERRQRLADLIPRSGRLLRRVLARLRPSA
jgi:hypothetical protein